MNKMQEQRLKTLESENSKLKTELNFFKSQMARLTNLVTALQIRIDTIENEQVDRFITVRNSFSLIAIDITRRTMDSDPFVPPHKGHMYTLKK